MISLLLCFPALSNLLPWKQISYVTCHWSDLLYLNHTYVHQVVGQEGFLVLEQEASLEEAQVSF